MGIPDSYQIIEQALLNLLRPIVRFCIRRAIRMQNLIEILKTAYVSEAAEQLRVTRQEVSHSRINVMTGVHRADVARIHRDHRKKPASGHVIARVVARWQSDKRFSSKAGRARVLSIEGLDSDFMKLVTAVSLDLNPYTLLFEMERTGMVQRTANGVRLCSAEYISKDLKVGLEFLSSDVDDLVEAVVQNLEEKRALPNLHLKTEYTRIPVERETEVKRWLLREGSAFHRKVQRYLGEMDLDSAPRSKRQTSESSLRVSLGSFSRVEKLEGRED